MAKTNTTPVATPKVTKMAQARELYARVTAKVAPEGKTHRGLFIDEAVSSGLLSAKAANTYFQTIKNSPDAPTVPAAAGLRAELQAIGTQMTQLNKRVNALSKHVA